jgi:hypothetical protein
MQEGKQAMQHSSASRLEMHPDANISNALQNQKSRLPLRYWQVDHFFTCPLAGMCLTPAEQKQLVKKFGLSGKKNTAFEIHEAIVSSAGSDNRLSRRTDALLQRKYGKLASVLLDLSDADILARFKRDFEKGDYLGTLWAVAIHPDVSAETKKEVFGEIHMSMHWLGGQRSKLKDRISRQQAELDHLHQRVREADRLKAVLASENENEKRMRLRLEAALAMAEKENQVMKAARATGQSASGTDTLAEENRVLKAELAAMTAAVKQKQNALAVLEEKHRSLQAALEQQEAFNTHFKEQTRNVMGELAQLNRCDPNCPSFDLCKKRILIVGGITRMATLYRELIESSGGVFEYHDGYMKNGCKQLESRLRRADVVLCPVSCNSHAACSMVKNLAKKHNKTVHMLANSSLSAVSAVIWGSEGSRAAIN